MNKNTLLKLDADARSAILKGANKVYEAVRRTLGPEGANGLIFGTYGRPPRITNDGFAISECVRPKDPFERLAADAFKEASKRTNELAGDGTTATSVMAGKLLNDVLKKLSESATVIKTKTGLGIQKARKEILETSKVVVEEIKKVAKKIETLEDLEKIAIISVENPELGKTIAKMSWDIGLNGHIDVVEGYKGEIETEIIRGMRFAAKVPAHVFANNEARYEMVVQDAPVVVTNYALDTVSQLTFVNNFAKAGKIVVLAPSFSDQVLMECVRAIKSNFHIFPVKTPSLREEQYDDIAVYFGARFIDKTAGKKLGNIKLEDAGFVQKLIVKETEMVEDAAAIGGKGEETLQVADRIRVLKEKIEETRIDSHKKLLERRIASLASAIGVIRVGSSSYTENYYIKKKVEDAVYACKAALEEGYVEGGGICLKKIAEALPESLMTMALKAPHEQIKENMEVDEIEINENIIDPAKAVRLSVEHAASVVAHLITAKIVIPEEPELTPYDGYSDIAKSIDAFTTFWARKEGLLKDSQMEIAKEHLDRYEDAILKNDETLL